MPFTPSDTLVLDTARLRVWQQEDDYAYSREKETAPIHK